MAEPRHVVVTGAASGIGAATARLLRGRGVRVTGIDRRPGGDEADAWIVADLSDPQAVARIATGPADALVNAAGLPPRPGDEARILSVNSLGLRTLTLHLLGDLRPGGAIVSMASKAGQRWRENLDQVRRLMALSGPEALPRFVAAEAIDPVRAYDLSKEAVIAWTKAMAPTLHGRKLRANTVSPAAVDTPILEDFRSAFGERAERGIRLVGRAGTAAEIAEVLVFLSGPESSWISGQDIAPDGGLAALTEAEGLGIRT